MRVNLNTGVTDKLSDIVIFSNCVPVISMVKDEIHVFICQNDNTMNKEV